MSSRPVVPALIVISAPSGAGKTTLCERLLRDFPSLKLSISTTTRAPRGTEKHGEQYFFVDRPEFEAEIARGGFAEWALVHGNYYGTSKLTLESAFGVGLHVLLDIDVQGAESLRQVYGPQCYTIFISPPSLEVLEARLRSRGTDSEETIQKRVRNAREEMEQRDRFNAVIINDSLEKAYEALKDLVARRIGH